MKHEGQQKVPNASALEAIVAGPDDDDLAFLKRVFAGRRWRARVVNSIHDAIAALDRDSPCLLLCEARWAEGDWKSMLGALADASHPPLLIVTSRTADDRLWAEVLNLGGYDVLTKPYENSEVVRVLSNAWSRCRHRRPWNAPPSQHSRKAS